MRVIILGAARQGLALARYLVRHGADVTLNDNRTAEQMQAAMQEMAEVRVRWVLGSHPLNLLDSADLVCISGGVPLTLPIVIEAQKRGIPLSNDTQVFMQVVPCPVIAITGSAGKTTTTTLVGRMAQAAVEAPRHAWVGGNIGLPLIDQVEKIHRNDVVVLEISSFQLEQMTISPQVAAILNITPNHLDRHGTLEAYTAAKARILDYQVKDDTAVLNREDPGCQALVDRVRGRLLTFGLQYPQAGQNGTFIKSGHLYFTDQQQDHLLIPQEIIALRGTHNLMNVLAACAIACAARFPIESMMKGVDGFSGVPHRLQLVGTFKGVAWYNDSIATAPERSMAAINSFNEPLVLLLGGRDKNLPWEQLVELVHARVDHVVLFGEAAAMIEKALGPVQEGQKPFSITRCTGLQDAVRAAGSIATPGSVVLLSPGGTSFDEFKDFEERGEVFQKWVHQLS